MTARPTCTDALDAALYESVHRGTPGDERFYVAECRGARDVLELGSGYGRLSIALARAGHRLTGLEIDPWLLRRARAAALGLPARMRARLRMRRGDMTDFELARRFDRVVIAYSTLYCLPSVHALSRCLNAARAHLRPGGVLLADAYAADDFHRRARADASWDRLEPLVQTSIGRSTWSISERSRHLHRERRVVVEYVCSRLGARPRQRTLTLRHRYFLRGELCDALERAGFLGIEVSGGFRGERLEGASERLVVRAVAA